MDEKKDIEKVKDTSRDNSGTSLALRALLGCLVVALLLTCVCGGLYIVSCTPTLGEHNHIVDDGEDQGCHGHKYHITYESQDGIEDDDVTIDTDTDTEFFIRKDSNGQIRSIAVADFQKGVYAIYIPRTEECYITSGINGWMANTTIAIHEYEREDGHIVHADTSEPSYIFGKASNTAINDHSILPYRIREFCKEKPLFWVHRITDKDTEDVATRDKRSACLLRVCEWMIIGDCSNPYIICRRWVCYDIWICYYEDPLRIDDSWSNWPQQNPVIDDEEVLINHERFT